MTKPQRVLLELRGNLQAIAAQHVESGGFTSTQEFIRAAIRFYDEKKNPPYVRGQAPISPYKKQKEQTMGEYQRSLAIELSARIEERNGTEYAVYKRYQELAGGNVDVVEVSTPLSDLTEEDVRAQYTTLMGENGEKARNVINELQK